MIESIELFKYSYTSEIIHQNQLNNLNPKINQRKHYIQKWHLGGVDIKITEKVLLLTFEILPQSLEIDFIDQELKIYPISGSWGMGTGKLFNAPQTTDGASWTWRTYSGSAGVGAEKWQTVGP